MMKLIKFRQTSDRPPRWEGRTLTGLPVAVIFMHTQIRLAVGTRRGGMEGARRKLTDQPTQYRPPDGFNQRDIRKHLRKMGLH